MGPLAIKLTSGRVGRNAKRFRQSIDQVGQNVIMAKGVAMAGVKSGRRAPDQDRVWYDLLQPGSRFQNSLKRWTHIHGGYHI